MSPPRNPYVAGNPVGGGPAFIGRSDVLREVDRILRREQDSALVLYGQRRIGKTSVLFQLRARLREAGHRPVYFDLQDKASAPIEEVLGELSVAVARELGRPAPDLGPDRRAGFRDRFLPDALRTLPEGRALVLLFDEFDVMADERAQGAAHALFPYLRELLPLDPQRLGFVFVLGRNIGDLTNIASSLFKGVPAVHVSLLERADLDALVRLSEANGTLRWSPAAVDAVWALTRGHPYLTQMLCSHVWEAAWDAEPAGVPEAGPEDVEAAIKPALKASDNALDWLWRGLGPAQRVVTSALAEAGPRAIGADELDKRLRMSGVRVILRELQDAPRLLTEWDLLEAEDDGWRFRVELFRRWVAARRPLKKVQEELDKIEPAADGLYQAARSLYTAGKLDQAVVQLRQALELNPSHVRASELLADLLLSRGELKEAREILERLHETTPGTARYRLVQVLGRLMEQAEGDELLDICGRILAIEPENAAALEKRRGLWTARADALRSSGDMEGAARLLRSAGLEVEAAGIEAEIERQALDEVRAMQERGESWQAFRSLAQLAERRPAVLEREAELVKTLSREGDRQKLGEAIALWVEGDEDGARQKVDERLWILGRLERFETLLFDLRHPDEEGPTELTVPWDEMFEARLREVESLAGRARQRMSSRVADLESQTEQVKDLEARLRRNSRFSNGALVLGLLVLAFFCLGSWGLQREGVRLQGCETGDGAACLELAQSRFAPDGQAWLEGCLSADGAQDCATRGRELRLLGENGGGPAFLVADLYRASCDAGHQPGCDALRNGLLRVLGRVAETRGDSRRAHALYDEACDAGDEDACGLLLKDRTNPKSPTVDPREDGETSSMVLSRSDASTPALATAESTASRAPGLTGPAPLAPSGRTIDLGDPQASKDEAAKSALKKLYDDHATDVQRCWESYLSRFPAAKSVRVTLGLDVKDGAVVDARAEVLDAETRAAPGLEAGMLSACITGKAEAWRTELAGSYVVSRSYVFSP